MILTLYFANELIQLMKETGNITSKNDNVHWPPQSCTLDNFYWSYVKSQVFKENPQSIPKIKDEIIGVTGKTEPRLCQNTSEHFNIKHLWLYKKLNFRIDTKLPRDCKKTCQSLA